MNKTCIFTIVSRNYLHYARTLMNSVEQFAPEATRIVGLCDEVGDFDFSNENFDLVKMDELEIEQKEKFIFRYTILELNTAIKPYIISALFNRGYEKVIYFDPDIRIYAELTEMLSLLDNHQMLLTPHLTGFIKDSKLPSELTILNSGTYNLGYIGLRNTAEMQLFAKWWEGKLYEDCVVDLQRGLFVDQKWMDLAPGLFQDVFINRNPAWNTAYWNINHREVTSRSGNYFVDDNPLTFFHFSGFSGSAKTLSKHQDRFTKKSAGPAVEQLCIDYANELIANGQELTSSIPYAYGTFADGTRIPDFARYIYREDYDWANSTDNPYEAQGCANYLGYLNEPVTIKGKRLPWITRLSLKLYNARADLKEAFPDLSGMHGKRFADWYIQSAAEQAGFDECFVLPVRHELHQIAESRGTEEKPETLKQKLDRNLYRLAWRCRSIVRPFVPAHLRQKAHVYLVEQLTSDVTQSPATPEPATPAVEKHARSAIDPTYPWGINLYGYVNAESGIGQSARSNIQNIMTTDVPLAVVDFREGNISRMNAQVPQEVMSPPIHCINLFHINADQSIHAINHLGPEVLKGKYNIGYWAWELPEFPEEWRAAFKLFNEIWVPSEFCKESISAAGDIPVTCIPHSIEPIQHLTDETPFDFALPADKVLFLTMFDALSMPERKNPEATIAAIRQAIESGNRDAHLVIKVSNLDKTPETQGYLKSLAKNESWITLIEGYLHRNEVYELISACDVFLSLHRSEGFGLGLAEAMLLGKPVIATNWSGNLQFMSTDNSALIDYQLIALDQDYGPYKKGQKWADVDLDSAVDAINRLTSDSTARESMGNLARSTINQDFSPKAIGLQIKERLAQIALEDQNLSKIRRQQEVA